MLARGHNFVFRMLLNLSPVFFYCPFIQKNTGNFDIYFDYYVHRYCYAHFFRGVLLVSSLLMIAAHGIPGIIFRGQFCSFLMCIVKKQ